MNFPWWTEGRLLIGMLHLPASPGLPGHPGVEAAVRQVQGEAELLITAGYDALLLENLHDTPALPGAELGPEVTAFVTRLAVEVRRLAGDGFPLGVQVLFQGNEIALAAAQAAGLQFVRVEGFTHAHVADKGPAYAQAGRLIRARARWGAADVALFADVRKKHAAHAWTADLDLAEWARAAEFARADGLIVTGPRTGAPAAADDLRAARAASALPLLVGSGLTAENMAAYHALADGFIVGSALKQGGRWEAPLDPVRVRTLARAFRALEP